MGKYLFSLGVLLLTACQTGTSQAIETIPPKTFQEQILKVETPQLIDVRTLEEFNTNHLKKAQHIGVASANFKQKVSKLDKSQPVYVYCKKGGRSSNAAQKMKDMGFKNVYDLDGGIESIAFIPLQYLVVGKNNKFLKNKVEIH